MKILIVDDEKNIRESLKKYLSLEGIDSTGAASGEEALEQIEKESFDAVVLDLKLPGINGQEVLKTIQQRGISSSPVLMISAHGQITDAVEALKAGAKDYLVKPFDPAEFIIKIRSMVENKRRENLIEAKERTTNTENSLVGNTAMMRELSGQIDKIAASGATVLITGESGTGKEVAAREIHSRSAEKNEPFVAVNIGGIHEGLMESELFGHEKGAFTGAAARKNGLFELAGRGSIFLDEIGEMPMSLQVKLLRVLQERKVRRLGGVSDIPVNARIISATNKDLETLIKENRFREDLYYRLNVVRINMPPLKDRREDIPLLAERFLSKISMRMGCPVPKLSTEALNSLLVYPFPGNIRELENILERALIYCEGNTITMEDIGLLSRKKIPIESISGGSSLEDVEKKTILDALVRCNGNRTKAAEILGVSRKTILNKIKAYGISD
ncbi:sigma-54-dependent Fis family transcriptional regulator [Spirochaetia bacterium]|nr:sigma-54-dependent Fis family transcriptional regulator [Spirochaetia bacterium]